MLASSLSMAEKESQQLTQQLVECLVHLMVLCTKAIGEEDSASDQAPGLKVLVGKLMALLAAGSSAPVFRSTLLSLPPAARTSLQVGFFQHIS